MGYGPSLFWESSLQEIFDLIESYNRKAELESQEKKAEIKMKIILDSVLAREIGEYVASLFDKKAQVTPIDKLFPELFSSEDIEEVENKKSIALYKAKMEDFAYRHNARLKRKEE